MSNSLVITILVFFGIALVEPLGALNVVLRVYARVRQFVKREDIEQQGFLRQVKREERVRSKEAMNVWLYLGWPARLILWWLICAGDRLNRWMEQKIEPYTRGLDRFLRLD